MNDQQYIAMSNSITSAHEKISKMDKALQEAFIKISNLQGELLSHTLHTGKKSD